MATAAPVATLAAVPAEAPAKALAPNPAARPTRPPGIRLGICSATKLVARRGSCTVSLKAVQPLAHWLSCKLILCRLRSSAPRRCDGLRLSNHSAPERPCSVAQFSMSPVAKP